MKKRWWRFTLAMVLMGSLWLSVACQNNRQDVATEVVAVVTPSADVTSVSSEPTPAPTEKPTSAPTTVSEPTVKATAKPTKQPTATSLPAATPTPIVLNSLAEIEAAGRNRFTGELPEDPELLNRRPIFCKISNYPPEYVRPQSGLLSADMVFEHMTEGPVTRFSALFYGKTPVLVGPVRSARLVDLELAPMYDAMLCYSGASIGVNERMDQFAFRGRRLLTWYDGYFRTGEDLLPEPYQKPFEHTFFAKPELFWQQLTTWERNRRPKIDSQVTFNSIAPEGGTDTPYLSVEYPEWTFVEWRWDEEIQQWRRWADDAPIVDKNLLWRWDDEELKWVEREEADDVDAQVTVSNVVVLLAVHTLDETICENQQDQKCLAGSTYIDLTTSGDGYLLRDGQRWPVVWRREKPNGMLTFFDATTKEPMPLQIGRTWVQIVAYHFEEYVQFEEKTP